MKPAIDKEGQSPHPDEGSAIRERTPSARPSSPELTVPRETRLEQKIAEAEQLLTRTPPNDPRRRLLQAAMLRRDEALLNAILTTLHEAAPISDPSPSRR